VSLYWGLSVNYKSARSEVLAAVLTRFIDIFIYYTVMHNTVNNSYRLSVLAYIQAINRPTLSRTYKKKKPYHSAFINLEKRSHSFYSNVTKFVKKSVKMDEETLVY